MGMIFRLIGAPSQRGSTAPTQLAAQSSGRPDCGAGTRNFSVFNSIVLRSSASVQSEPSHIQRESVKDGAGNSVRLSSRRGFSRSMGVALQVDLSARLQQGGVLAKELGELTAASAAPP